MSSWGGFSRVDSSAGWRCVFFRVDFSIGWCGFFKVGFLLDEVYLFSRV